MYYQLAQQEFESYLNGYDRENDRIKIKKSSTPTAL